VPGYHGTERIRHDQTRRSDRQDRTIQVNSQAYWWNAHQQEDLCFGNRFTELTEALTQTCPAGHKYLADSPEYPCHWCTMAKFEDERVVMVTKIAQLEHEALKK
jgi:hypothetical protein